MALKKQREKRLRFLFGAAFFLLLMTEVFIALYVHDSFIRPYIGDCLVVIVLYFGLRTIFPKPIRLLPLWLFLFASGVEILQYFHLVELLGLENHVFLKILIGSTFDLNDILCYGAGCLFLALLEFFCSTAFRNRIP